MSTGTINSPAPERHLPPQQDPWGAAVEGAVDEHGRIQLSEAEVAARYHDIMSRYHDPEPAQAQQSPGNIPSPHNEHIPTSSPEDIARRERASLMATYAVAHTLRAEEPQLLNDLVDARPADYQGRHARPRGYQGRHRR